MHRRVGQGQLRVLAWVAIVVALLLALAPTISSVLRGANYAAWVNVCRSNTVVAGAPAPSSGPAGLHAPDGNGHLGAHCPYCSLHADALPPAPGFPSVPRDTLPAFLEPQAFLQSRFVEGVWLHALSRAPPWLS